HAGATSCSRSSGSWTLHQTHCGHRTTLRKRLVLEMAETHLARAGGEQGWTQTQETARHVVLISGNFELHPVLRPLFAVRAIPHRHDMVVVAEPQEIVTTDHSGLVERIGPPFRIFEHGLLRESQAAKKPFAVEQHQPGR